MPGPRAAPTGVLVDLGGETHELLTWPPNHGGGMKCHVHAEPHEDGSPEDVRHHHCDRKCLRLMARLDPVDPGPPPPDLPAAYAYETAGLPQLGPEPAGEVVLGGETYLLEVWPFNHGGGGTSHTHLGHRHEDGTTGDRQHHHCDERCLRRSARLTPMTPGDVPESLPPLYPDRAPAPALP